MALCRCESCGVKKSIQTYVPVNPVDYPNAALICGATKCTNHAKIWLNNNEYIDYQNGVKTFRGSNTNFAKVRVD